MKLTVKDIPPRIRSAFPEYQGRKWSAEVTTHVFISDTNWDGGTKNTYRAVDLMSGKVHDPDPRAMGPWYRPNEPKLEIPSHFVVVEHSYFMGKDVGITIYVRPEDARMALPQAHTKLLTAGGKRRHAHRPSAQGARATKRAKVASKPTRSRLGQLVADINRLVR